MNQRLSERERQLIARAAEGLTDAQIAKDLGISFGTVATYWNRLRAKFAGSSRTEVVAKAMRFQCEEVFTSMQDQVDDLTARLNEALKITPGSTRLSYHALAQVPGATIVVNESQEIIFANGAAHELFGFKRRELEGSRLAILIPERYRRAHSIHFREYMQESDHPMATFGATALHRTGAEFAAFVSVGPFDDGDERVLVCLIHPTTVALHHGASLGSARQPVPSLRFK